MAYVDERAVDAVVDAGPVDLLITHQGPAEVQGSHGSPTLDRLLEAGTARFWFHGHSTPIPDLVEAGSRPTTVVPLGDVAFQGRGRSAGDPGLHGWSYLRFDGDEAKLVRETPPFWREYRQKFWAMSRDGQFVCPDLKRFVP